MTQPTPEQIRESIVPKSDQLNADSLIAGPITVTVQAVTSGDKEQPIVIVIDGGHQPFKPCKSMRRVLIKAWGDDGAAWCGRRMTIYNDPDVKWAGVKVGGCRISHLSDIGDKPLELSLTETRGKRASHTIRPIAESSTPTLPERINACVNYFRNELEWNDGQILKAIGKKGVDQITEDDVSTLRGIAEDIKIAAEQLED